MLWKRKRGMQVEERKSGRLVVGEQEEGKVGSWGRRTGHGEVGRGRGWGDNTQTSRHPR